MQTQVLRPPLCKGSSSTPPLPQASVRSLLHMRKDAQRAGRSARAAFCVARLSPHNRQRCRRRLRKLCFLRATAQTTQHRSHFMHFLPPHPACFPRHRPPAPKPSFLPLIARRAALTAFPSTDRQGLAPRQRHIGLHVLARLVAHLQQAASSDLKEESGPSSSRCGPPAGRPVAKRLAGAAPGT
jgi:hypothetical protein